MRYTRQQLISTLSRLVPAEAREIGKRAGLLGLSVCLPLCMYGDAADCWFTGGETGGVSYEEKGRTWHTLSSAEGFVEEGTASWYGPGFHGRFTASGEKYNQFAMTAAHTILPLQTEVRVKNLENGRTVVLRINDRGPFVNGRVIDLSRAAAQKLGVLGPGTARVRITSLDTEAPEAAPVADVNGTFFIQVGVFGEKENADRAAATLAERGFPAVQKTTSRGNQRVLAGPWPDLNTANDKLWSVRQAFPEAYVMSDDGDDDKDDDDS